MDEQDPTGEDGMSENQYDETHPENPLPDDQQYALTFEAMQRLKISVGELWVYYLGMGGDIDEYEVSAYLHGLIYLPPLDRDVISQAVNEMHDDICRIPKAPYSTPQPGNSPPDPQWPT